MGTVNQQDVNAWFAANPNATQQQIYNAAQQYGVSGSMIDTAMGNQAGTANNYVAQQGWNALPTQATPMTDVASLYQQYLGRAPEQAGLDYWNKQFGASVDPTEAQTFLAAAQPELQKLNPGGYQWTDQQVAGAKDFLSKNTDPTKIYQEAQNLGLSAQAAASLYAKAKGENYGNVLGQFNDYLKTNNLSLAAPTQQELMNSSLYSKYGVGYDPTKLQVGLPQDYTTQDIQGALGKYNILNQAGQNVGVGYKSVADTVKQYQTDQMMKYATPVYQGVNQYDELGNMRYDLMNPATGQYDPEKLKAAGYTLQTDPYNPESQKLVKQMGYTFDQPMGSTSGLYANQYGEEGSPQTFSTLEEARNALSSGKVNLRNEAGQSIYMPGMDSKWFTQEHGGDIAKSAADWEALGQILSGGQVASPQEWGALPINQQTEKITGEQSLYGSKPVFYNGQLIGYEADLGLGGVVGKYDNGQARGTEDYHFKQWGPLGYAVGEDTTGHNWASALQRNIDPNAYKGLVTGLGGTQYFAPVENVSKLPGWENKEMYGYQDRKSDDWSLLKNVNNLMKSTNPIAWNLENEVGKALGYDNGLDMVRSIGQPIGDALGTYFTGLPIGSMIMTAEGASLGNEDMATKAALNAVAQMAMPYVGSAIGSVISPAVSGALGSYAGTAIGNTTLGAITTQALTSATTAGLMAGAKGGDWGDVGSAMLTSGLTSGVGQVSNAYLQGYLQNSLGMSADTSKLAASSLSKGLTTTLSSLADGADAEKSFIQGAIAGGTQYIANTLRNGIKDSLPESMQGKITDSVLNSLVDAAAKYIGGQITGGNTNLKQILDTASNQVAQNIATGDTTKTPTPTEAPTPAPTPAPTEAPKGGLTQATTTPAIVPTPTAGYNKSTQASSGLGPFYLAQGTPGLARGTYNPVSWI